MRPASPFSFQTTAVDNQCHDAQTHTDVSIVSVSDDDDDDDGDSVCLALSS